MGQREEGTRSIMVVEDFDDTRFMLKAALEARGYRVVEATNGKDAVSMAEQEHPDLILMDLDLPILDGIAATQTIRKNEDTAGVPIIALTAYPLSFTRVKAFAEGCNEYISKPVDFERLDGVLRQWLPSMEQSSIHAGRTS